MKIGIVDIDGHNFPNLSLMKISAYHKLRGDSVEWATPFEHYDILYKAKVFTFSEEDQILYNADKVICGGTGFDIKSRLPEEIEACDTPDYSIYPMYDFTIQFFSRGCIRKCPFCLVSEKEGFIRPVHPMKLNQKGKWIEVLDNNFFANPEWKSAVDWLNSTKQPVKLHGVDVRIIDHRQANALNSMRLKGNIHIAWDLPQIDITEKLELMARLVKSYKITCYVLVGFNSTKEQDLYRLETLKRLNILPFVQPYRDFENKRTPTNYEKDLARWANRAWLFKTMDFKDFKPRKNFICKEYLN